MSPKVAPLVPGMVEDFTRRVVVGWVSVPADAPPTRVTLHIGNFEVVGTYATPGSSLSGIYVGGDGSVVLPRARTDASDGALWGGAMIKGPPRDRRNSQD